MKFIPVTAFDKLNAGMTAIEARGCYVTTKLEAFSCRNTKTDKGIKSGIVSKRIEREQERQEFIKSQQQIMMAMTPPMHPQSDPRKSGGSSSGGVSHSGSESLHYNANHPDVHGGASGERCSLDGGGANNNNGVSGFSGIYSPPTSKNLDYADDDFLLDGDTPQQNNNNSNSGGGVMSSWREDCPLPYCGPMGGVSQYHPTPPLGFQKQQSSSGAFPSVLPSSNMGSRVQSLTVQGETPYTTSPQTQLTNESSIDDVDNRLVHLVGALNAIHGAVDYDFTCLETSDFNLLQPMEFFNEINEFLTSLPQEVLASTVGPINGELFWGAIASLVGGDSMLIDLNNGTSDCEFFQFVCPTCDPIAQSKIWSNHYFVYNRRHHVIVSVLVFGEGNLYRGDGGYGGGAGDFISGGSTPRGHHNNNNRDEESYGGAAKNASFFGFHGNDDETTS